MNSQENNVNKKNEKHKIIIQYTIILLNKYLTINKIRLKACFYQKTIFYSISLY